MTKKCISALLTAAVLVFGTGAAGAVGTDAAEIQAAGSENQSVAATVRIEGNDMTVLAPAELSVDAGMYAALTGLEAGTVPTAADALVEGAYFSVYAKDPVVSDLDEEAVLLLSDLLSGVDFENGWISSMFGYTGADVFFWMYSSGKTTPSGLITEYEVKSNDELCFYFADWMMGCRAYFDKAAYNGSEEDTIAVKVTAINILNEMYGTYEEIPISGAELLIGEGFSAETPTGIFTDENGVAYIEAGKYEPGTYSLSAKWEEEEYGYNLTRAYASLTIEEKKPNITSGTVYGIFTSGLSDFTFSSSATEYDLTAKVGFRDYVLALKATGNASVTYSLNGGAYQQANNTSSGVPAFYFSIQGEPVTLKAKVALKGAETVYTFRITPLIATNQIPRFGTSGFEIPNYNPEIREYVVTPMMGFAYYRLWGYRNDGATEILYAVDSADTPAENASYNEGSFGNIPFNQLSAGNMALFVKVTPQYAKTSGYYKFIFR